MKCNRFYSPKCAIFGYDCMSEVVSEIKSLGLKKALIITDVDLIKFGIVNKITDALETEKIKYAIYDGVLPNPMSSLVEEGTALLRKENCDFCLSIGGGSAHDTAKGICILATNGGSIFDYAGLNKSKEIPLPLVAVNTTAGTASEFTAAYVIVNEETGFKSGSRDKNVISSIAVDDWSLMMSLPKGLTAGTGMDALTHAIEAYTAIDGFELTRAIGMAAVREVFKYLEKAVLEPDEEVRGGMAVAQYMAGMAFGNSGCGLVHSMSHQLSAVYNFPHGTANAVLLPTVMRFNASCEEGAKRYAELADAVFPYETIGKVDSEKANVLIEHIEDMSRKIGIPSDLNTMGAKAEDISLLANKAMKDGSLVHNVIQPTQEQVESLYKVLIKE